MSRVEAGAWWRRGMGDVMELWRRAGGRADGQTGRRAGRTPTVLSSRAAKRCGIYSRHLVTSLTHTGTPQHPRVDPTPSLRSGRGMTFEVVPPFPRTGRRAERTPTVLSSRAAKRCGIYSRHPVVSPRAHRHPPAPASRSHALAALGPWDDIRGGSPFPAAGRTGRRADGRTGGRAGRTPTVLSSRAAKRCGIYSRHPVTSLAHTGTPSTRQ